MSTHGPEDESVLEEAARLTSTDRAATHGDAREQHAAVGRMWGAMLGVDDIPPHLVMAMMVALKLSRISHGNPRHRDSYVDGCGYLTLAWDAVSGQADEDGTSGGT